MTEPSAFLLDLIEKNNIPGCMILLREEENGDVHISHAENNIHEINIIQSLAAIIAEKNSSKLRTSNLSKCIQHAAETIMCVCQTIKDLTEEEEDGKKE